MQLAPIQPEVTAIANLLERMPIYSAKLHNMLPMIRMRTLHLEI